MTGSTHFRKFATSSSAAFAVRMSAAGVAFLMTVAVTRTLGAHQAGIFFLGNTLLLILAMFARFGLDHVLIRFVSTSIDQANLAGANGVVWKAASIVAPLSITIAAAIYFLNDVIANDWIHQPELAPVLRSVAFCIVPFSCFQLLSYAMQGRKQFAWSMLINSTLFPAAILMFVLFPNVFGVSTAGDLMRLAVWSCTAIAILSIGMWLKGVGTKIDPIAYDYRAIRTMAIPIYVLAILSFANTWTPQLVLAAWAPADQIAILNVSQKTAGLIALLILPISTVASPAFAVMYERKQMTEIRDFAGRVNGIILAMCVPVLFVLFVFAPQVLAIFGSELQDAKWVLRVLVVGHLFNSFSGSFGYLLMMSGNERALRNTTAVSAGAGLALSFGLIPMMGAIGGAIAVTGSMILTNIFIWLIVRDRLGINVFRPDFRFAIDYWRQFKPHN